MSAYLWPLSRTTVLDLNGDVSPGALLNFWVAATTTPLVTYQDSALTTPHPNVIAADAAGRLPAIYMHYTDYRQRLRTAGGTLLFDDDGIANPAPPIIDTTVPLSQRMQTGMLSLSFGPQDGYVRLNGLTIGNGSSGATERANDDTKPLYLYLYEYLEDAVAPVSGGRGANAETDYAAGKPIALPNFQGRTLAGIIGMGGSASTILDAVTFTAGAKDKAGSTAGAATHTLTEAQMPAHNHPGSVTDVQGEHTHGYLQNPSQSNYGGGPSSSGADPTSGTTSPAGAHGHNLALTTSGGGTAHNNMQPTGLVYLLVKL